MQKSGNDCKRDVRRLAVDDLVLDSNMREQVEGIEALAEKLKTHGQIELITVSLRADGKFDVINGSRRVRAAKLLGLTHLDGVVVVGGILEQLVMAASTEDFKPCEFARGMQRGMVDHGFTQAQMAAMLGKSEGFVSKKLALLLLPLATQAEVDSGALAESKAYLLAKESDAARRQQIELMAAGNASRDAIAGAVRRPKHSENGNGHVKRVLLAMPGDRAVSVVGAKDIENTIGLLEETLGKLRKLRTQGVELGTAAKMFRDQSKGGAQ